MNVKEALFEQATKIIEEKISIAESAIQSARSAVENETKSSAGDKYETSREMLQQEIRMAQSQLFEVSKLKHALSLVNPQRVVSECGPGALMETNHGNFYVSAGLGQIQVNGTYYQLISSASPIAKALAGTKSGESILFNGRKIQVYNLQ